MESIKHLSCSPLQKKLTAYSRQQFPEKKSALDVWEAPKEYQLLLWWILPQILAPPLNLRIWCRRPVPSLITHPNHPTIKLPRIQIFKTGFRKLLILSKFREWCRWWGWGVILFASLWRIAYDLYVTHLLIYKLFKNSLSLAFYRIYVLKTSVKFIRKTTAMERNF